MNLQIRNIKEIKSKNKAKKAQLLSSELVIALIIFLIAISIFIFTWNLIFNSYTEEKQIKELEFAAKGISDKLIYSPGDPSYWENNYSAGVNSLGLATSPGIFSGSKIWALSNMSSSNYTFFKQKIGAGRFNVYIEIIDTSSSQIIYSFGIAPNKSDSSIIYTNIKRLGMLNESLVNLDITLWDVKK